MLKLQYFGHLMWRATHWKRPWCWERLKAEGEGDNRGWDGWMASPAQWTWAWVDSRSWWWTWVSPSSRLILCCPLLLLPPISPSTRVFSNESTLHMRWPKYWSLASASFLPKKSQGWSLSEWTSWISLQSKGPQESSPTPQFKRINSSALSLLPSPTLTSIQDYWKNHSLD